MSCCNTRHAPIALTSFRSLSVGATAVEVSASPRKVHRLNLINRHSATVYVKLYDKAAASVDAASDVPAHVFVLAASPGTQVLLTPESLFPFSTAVSVRCVTGAADNDTTAPATLPMIEVGHAAMP